MDSADFEKPCIALERNHWEPKLFTVADYDGGLDWSRCIAYHALPFFELTWTLEAPAVENLTEDGIDTKAGRFRISDPEAYDLQMRRLFGLV